MARRAIPALFSLVILASFFNSTSHAEPVLSSWYTEDSGRYARIWATMAAETMERGGGGMTSLTIWDVSLLATRLSPFTLV
ncbi:hypothetical protein ACWPKO_04380 [Coraliomargarita sp. W4R53]